MIPSITRLRFTFATALLLLVAAAPVTGCDSPTGSGRCCKVCTEGKACGDTCIARNETCTKGAGCACNR